MTVPIARLPEGTRIRVRRGPVPQDPAITGRTGVVAAATEYRNKALGVVLDGESAVRWFIPGELEVIKSVPMPPERELAKTKRALP